MTDYATIDLSRYLPSDWRDRVSDAVRAYGQDVRVKGKGPGSLEDEDTAGLDYRVVDGQAIWREMQWLWELYVSDEWCRLVGASVGEKVKPSINVKSAININYLRGMGGRYELHVDGQPYSAVMQCDSLDAETGGRLVLQDRHDSFVNPKPALWVVFDGSKVPHAVEALKRPSLTRTSIPMVYVPLSADERPDGLDDYLYARP